MHKNVRSFLLAALLLSVTSACFPIYAQDDPDENEPDPVALFEKAQDAHEKGDLTAAIELYEKAIEAADEFPEAEYQRAMALLSLGKKAEAEKGLRKAVLLRPEWTLPLASLGSLLVGKGEYSEAKLFLNRSIEQDSQNVVALSALTELSLKTKASPEILRALLVKVSQLTDKAKPTAAAWAARAALEVALNERSSAKASFQRSLEIDPNNLFALRAMASALLDDADLKGADQVIKRLEEIEPGSASIVVLRARALHASGKTQDALEKLDSITDAAPDAAALRRSIMQIGLTDPVKVEAELASDPNNVVLLGKLCSLYRTSDPAKALEYCRKASEQDPKEISYALGYAAALVQSRSFDDAVTLLRRLQAISPDNLTLRANLATALFQLKRYTEAKTEFDWLAEKQPDAAAAYYFLGIIHDHLAEYADAMANYQIFLRKADGNGFKDEISRVNLRLPILQKQIKSAKGKRN
ncbi:MAG TPA: tetratricopeptide repeat protein [Pyrinomonadaceae bacterium]|nr:tetratricopeptide repeat protein [Pyrinomonadaceae bacterium]